MKVKIRTKNPNSNNDDLARKRALARERSRRYREKLKQDPDRLRQIRENAAERKRTYRANRSEKRKEIDRRTGLIRQKKYIQRQTEAASPQQGKSKTRATHEKEKEYWRNKKREQRAALSSQKKRRIKEKDKEYRRKRRAQLSESLPASSQPTETSSSAVHTPAARRKALSRAKRHMPTNPTKYAGIVSDMISKATPEQQIALEQEGITPNLKSTKKKLQFGRSFQEILLKKEDHQSRNEKYRRVKRAMVASLRTLKKSRLLRYTSRETAIRWKYLMRYTKKDDDNFSRETRSDKLNETTANKVKEFYQREDISTTLPNIKTAKNDAPGKVLNKPVNELYHDYRHLYPEEKIGQTVFSSLHPQNVLPARKRCLVQCLCEYCVNIDEAVKSINRTCMSHNLPNVKVNSKTSLISMSLCPTDSEYHRRPCVDRECNLCGVHTVRAHFGPAVDASKDNEITYHQWESETYQNRNGKNVSRKTYITKRQLSLNLLITCVPS